MFKSTATSSIHIGIYGREEEGTQENRSFALWPVGYRGTIVAAEAQPIFLQEKNLELSWQEILHGIDGVVLAGSLARNAQQASDEEAMARFCREHRIPLLAIDQGLHIMNVAFGGTLYMELARELPEALQHRHPPEKGLRHAINVARDTRLAELYGEGEVVVNSEHRKAVKTLAKGFRVSATALDGVVEAVETDSDRWYAMGVQWRPASVSASGLDIQVFRGLITACQQLQAALAEETAFQAA